MMVDAILNEQTRRKLLYGDWSVEFIVGVTGAERGMNDRQALNFWWLLSVLKPAGLRHGDCVGVDVQAAHLADSLDIPTFSHPGFSPKYPEDSRFRAFHKSTTIYEPKTFLERDEDIASKCSVLVACPAEPEEVLRSGTWATVRYARKYNTPRIILLP